MAPAKAIWIKKSNLVTHEAREKSLDSASCEVNSAFHRAQPRLSREVKAKTPLCADNEANISSLSLPTWSAKTVLSRKARTRAPLSANDLYHEANIEAPLDANSEATPTSLKVGALQCRAKLASTGRAKATASPCEANSSGEAILALSTTMKLAFKAKPRVFQPKKANIQPPQFSVLDHLDPANIDLREYLSNKRKFHPDEPIHI